MIVSGFFRAGLAISVTAFLLAPLGAASSDDYPNRPVTMVVPYSPGGPNDISGRMLAQQMSQELGQPVVVDNTTGAGGLIGAMKVARAAPDGYNLLYVATSALSIGPWLTPELKFKPLEQLAAITQTNTFPLVLITNAALPVASLKDFIAYAKEHPGGLSFGSPGIGTLPHMAAELFMRETGVKAAHVPYRGGAPAFNAAVSGEVQFVFDSPSLVISRLPSNDFRVLAIASRKRIATLPDVPTFAEQGYSSIVVEASSGLLTAAGASPDLVRRINAVAVKALADGVLKTRFAAMQMAASPSSPNQYEELVKDDIARWSPILRSMKIDAK